MTIFNPSKFVTRSLIGAVGLSAIAVLGVPEITKAAPDCGPGDNWIETCESGMDFLRGTTAYLMFNLEGGEMVNLILDADEAVKITREDPVDSIVGDPDFAGVDVGFGEGNVGITDDNLSVIKTNIEERFSGGGFTLTGTGTGAIVEATDFGINRPDLAWSFFNVFATIEGDFGQAKNSAPIVVEANQWLTGVSPQEIAPVGPPPELPSSFVGTANGEICDETDPLAAILYCGFEEVQFFLVNDEGEFIDENGDPLPDQDDPTLGGVLYGTLTKEVHSVPPHVPEPSTTLGILFLGLGSVVGLKRRDKAKK